MKNLKLPALLATIAAVSSFSSCTKSSSQGASSSSASSVPLPAHGLVSPFAQNKMVLSPSFSGQIAKLTGAAQANVDTSNASTQIPAGANLVFILSDTCMQARHALTAASQGVAISYFINKYIAHSYYGQSIGKFDESALSISLDSPILIGDLHRIGQTDPCVVGITNAEEYQISGSSSSSTPIAYNDPAYPTQSNYLNQINFATADAFFNANVPSTVKVNVAVIDTGFDLKNADIGPLSPILTGSDIAGSSSIPQDTDGHGTEVASIITAQGNNATGIVGIAGRNTTLLPIRLFSQALSPKSAAISAVSLFSSVKLAVNAGADIVNMSFSTDAADLSSSGNTMSCDILTGYAIYRAILGGTFFSIAAGQWTSFDKLGNPIPGLITAPKENGPLPVGLNSVPACWGRYYQGALTVGALTTGTQALASFSNFGSDAVEISAPATSMETYGLGNQLMQVSGSSLAAAEVSAAAALTIAFHKQQGWPYSPWLIEDIIMNGSTSSSTLASNVLGGKMLDLNALVTHLEQLETETQTQRLEEPSYNPEAGVTFQAGSGTPATGNVNSIQIYTDTPIIQSDGANRGQMQVVAYFSNASFEVVTNAATVTYSVSDQTKATIDSQGILYPVQGASGGVTVTANYMGRTATTSVEVVTFNVLTGMQSSLNSLVIEIVNNSAGYGLGNQSIPIPEGGAITNLCPMPPEDANLVVAWQYPNPSSSVMPQSVGAGPAYGGFELYGDYSDGSMRDLGSLNQPPQASVFITEADGTALVNDDVGGSTTLVSAIYRGKQASFTMTHAKIPATSTSWDLTNSTITLTRGNLLQPSYTIQTSGNCSAFLMQSVFGGATLDPSTGQAELANLSNVAFAGQAWSGDGLQMSFSSPQPVLNALLVGQGVIPNGITVGNALPAGTYTINGIVTYRGGGTPQVLTLPPLTLILKENLPVAAIFTSIPTETLGTTYNYSTAIQLQDGTVTTSSPYNFTFKVTDKSGNLISLDATNPNATVWWDTTPSGPFMGVNSNIFSGAVGDTYTLTATENTTGLSVSHTFTVQPPAVYHYTGTYVNAVQPSLTAADPKIPVGTTDGYCTTAAMQASPFAGGSGTQTDPYMICTPTQFLAISKVPASTTYPLYTNVYQLKQNLDFGSMGNLSSQAVAPLGNTSIEGNNFSLSNFTAIDTEAAQMGIISDSLFTLTISDLVVINPTISGVMAGGLIGYTQGSSTNLTNVFVSGGTVSGGGNSYYEAAGGLIGMSYSNDVLTGCYALGTELSSQYGGFVGGLVGFGGGTMLNSGANTTIRNIGPPGSMSNVGGLIGSGGGTVVSSYAKGTISGATNNAGGLIGAYGGGAIVASASSVEVIAQGSNAGGLVGSAQLFSAFAGQGIIYNSLATGQVWGGASNQGGSNSGGFIGYATLILIENSQATGNVSGVSNIGGFIGMDDGFNQINNSSELGQATASAGPVGGWGGLKTQYNKHNLNGIYSGDTWSLSNNTGHPGYGTYLSNPVFTPTGISGK